MFNSFDPTDCVNRQAPLSTGFPRQEYWSGLPFPSPGDLPDSGIEPWPPALQVGSLPTEPVIKLSQLDDGGLSISDSILGLLSCSYFLTFIYLFACTRS